MNETGEIDLQTLLEAELAQIPARVERGVADQDSQHGPGNWRKMIDESRFDVRFGNCCVVGQTGERPPKGYHYLDAYSYRFGVFPSPEAANLGYSVPLSLVEECERREFDRESRKAETAYWNALENRWREVLGFPRKDYN